VGEVVEVAAWLENHAAHLRKMQEIGALPETELQEMLDRAATLLQQPSAPAPAVPEAGEVGEFELTPREVEAQEAFTQLRDEVLNLSEGAELNKVLRIIDNHTPEWV
jgi:hypothetical protein